MCVNIEPLCCTPGTDIILYVNYIHQFLKNVLLCFLPHMQGMQNFPNQGLNLCPLSPKKNFCRRKGFEPKFFWTWIFIQNFMQRQINNHWNGKLFYIKNLFNRKSPFIFFCHLKYHLFYWSRLDPHSWVWERFLLIHRCSFFQWHLTQASCPWTCLTPLHTPWRQGPPQAFFCPPWAFSRQLLCIAPWLNRQEAGGARKAAYYFAFSLDNPEPLQSL